MHFSLCFINSRSPTQLLNHPRKWPRGLRTLSQPNAIAFPVEVSPWGGGGGAGDRDWTVLFYVRSKQTQNFVYWSENITKTRSGLWPKSLELQVHLLQLLPLLIGRKFDPSSTHCEGGLSCFQLNRSNAHDCIATCRSQDITFIGTCSITMPNDVR